MARIQNIKEPTPLVIDRFYGYHVPKSGDTQIEIGESGNMYNCFITKDYDLSKAYGYLKMFANTTEKSIQGMWSGDIAGDTYFLFAFNGHLYKINSDLWLDFDSTTTFANATTDLGTLTDAPTKFFAFANKVYILNGAEYKYYDGTTFGDVAGYIPKIIISAVPLTGAGTDYENINLLTGKKRMTFSSDNTNVYQLAETSITSVDAVYVSGVLKTVTTHYTVDLTTGKITFTSGNIPPLNGLDNVEIYWTKGTGTRALVVNNRYARLFGSAVDTRVFLYGNVNYQNKRIFSSLADGVPSVEYFTAASIEPIGSENTPITDMHVVNGNLITFKPSETYTSYYDEVDLDGIVYVSFPTSIINETRGCRAVAQGQILNNDIHTIDYQFIRWFPTSEKNEKNMKDVGDRIQTDLDELDLTKCLTVDKQNTSEMWIVNGKTVYIYKYDLQGANRQNGVFSKLVLAHTPTCLMFLNGDVWFGTDKGLIMRVNEEYLTYNGTTISSHWEMNMYDFGASWLNKSLNKSWLKLAAQPKASVNLQYATDRSAYSTPYVVSYAIATFDDVDYGNFTFYTNYNPKTFYLRLKAKKFCFVKLILDNASADETFILLELVLKAEFGNERK